MSGAYGGHTVDFRDFAAQGITLLGHAGPARDGVMPFADDLAANLAHGDASYFAFLDAADAYIAAHGLDFPAEPDARRVGLAIEGAAVRQLDLRSAGIGTVIWATGYAADFRWIRGADFDPRGVPLHHRGVTGVPGLYLLGLPYLSRFVSSFLSGVGADAARLADHIVARGVA
jgi:putative flavoprotein involved in K+ transport